MWGVCYDVCWGYVEVDSSDYECLLVVEYYGVVF